MTIVAYIPLLSESYQAGDRYAYCKRCKVAFRDDMAQWGSLLCPLCHLYPVQRGIGEDELDELDLSGNESLKLRSNCGIIEPCET